MEVPFSLHLTSVKIVPFHQVKIVNNVVIIDGLNVLKKNKRFDFENIQDLLNSVVEKLVPLIDFCMRRITNPSIIIVLKSFCIKNYSAIVCFKSIMSIINMFFSLDICQCNVKIKFKCASSTQKDKEADDRLIWIYKEKYPDAIIFSSDKFRSMKMHYQKPVHYYSVKLNYFNSPHNIQSYVSEKNLLYEDFFKELSTYLNRSNFLCFISYNNAVFQFYQKHNPNIFKNNVLTKSGLTHYCEHRTQYEHCVHSVSVGKNNTSTFLNKSISIHPVCQV